jgi:hypothetical protein
MNNENPRAKTAYFVANSHPADDSRPKNVPPGSIQRQAAEYRARPAGRQLGAEILESLSEKPAKTVLLRSLRLDFFNDYPSSELKYTALEPTRKGVMKKPASKLSQHQASVGRKPHKVCYFTTDFHCSNPRSSAQSAAALPDS